MVTQYAAGLNFEWMAAGEGARRVIILLLTLWTAVTVNFLIPRLMPGNPAPVMLAKFHGKGPISPQSLHAIEVMLGISNESMWKQYLQYWGSVLHFNFGVSYTYFPYSVSHMISQSLPWTLVLVGVTTVLSFVIGTLLGILSAWRQGKPFSDTFVTSLFTFTSSFPYFWFALLCAFFLSYVANLFPLNGGYNPNLTPGFNFSYIASMVNHSILPAFTILVSSIGGWQLGMRNNMLTALSEDYVTLAKARGLSNVRITISYAARNAILPNMTGFAMSLGFIVGGSVLTELDAIRAIILPFWKNKVARIGTILLLLFLLMAIFAPLIAPYSPTDSNFQPMLAPSSQHLLGTTQNGEDVLSQLFYGSRVSLMVGFVAGVATTVLSLIIGLVGGYLALLRAFPIRKVRNWRLSAFPGHRPISEHRLLVARLHHAVNMRFNVSREKASIHR